jgi:hypothetical protein
MKKHPRGKLRAHEPVRRTERTEHGMSSEFITTHSTAEAHNLTKTARS